MVYRVVPFVASISSKEGSEIAAKQLEELINRVAKEGWDYERLENIETIITDPGKAGCFGLGAVPPSQVITRYDMVVFSRK